jgi:phytoene/squalene synthetase
MSQDTGIDIPSGNGKDRNLPAEITRQASKQTYYTFRFLVERRHRQDAYRAYAYFRWVDDRLDCNTGTKLEKIAFLNRQRALLEACYRKESYPAVGPEEQMLVDMIVGDHEACSGLQYYLRNMMAVMEFDVERKGRVVSQAELNQYTRWLATAVSELLFCCIDHDELAPRNPGRYQAVRGAHIAHMLRDMLEDIDLGYINLPTEVLHAGQVSLDDLQSQAARQWVMERVRLAHQCFIAGRKYFEQVKSLRCRLAAYAYLARFEWMLHVIERDGYRLRRAYPERKGISATCWMARRVIKSLLNLPVHEDLDRLLALPD